MPRVSRTDACARDDACASARAEKCAETGAYRVGRGASTDQISSLLGNSCEELHDVRRRNARTGKEDIRGPGQVSGNGMPKSSGEADEPLRKKRGERVSRYVRSFCCSLILRSDRSRVGMTGLLQLEPDEDVNEIESGLPMIPLKEGPVISSREHSRCGGKRGYRRNDEKGKIYEQSPSDDLMHHTMLHETYYNTSVFTCKYESALQGASHYLSAGFWTSPWSIGVGFAGER